MNRLVKKACMLISIAFLVTGVSSGQKQEGVTVKHLGVNNTLIEVTGQGKYLCLPVQESAEESAVHILVDGKLERTLNVRLAISKVDYTVPFDLAAYRGKNLLLNIVTPQSRATVREAKEDACWKNFTVSNTFDTANREKYRPAYHHTPLYGWMNDPNGMVYKDSVWHLCYQWNPYGSKWQNLSWGHSTSSDLIHWEHHKAVLQPDGLGMIFSGSSAVDSRNSAGFGANSIVALYTSAAESQIQSLAYSTDGGQTFNTYPANPVLTLESEARDPNMFWNDESKLWTMVLAHALEKEMLFFTSPDLKQWTLQSRFGKDLGAQGGVWECPDLFQLPVSNTGEKKWVLLCNINPGGPQGGSATQYFVGEFDGKNFKADRDADGNVPTKWMDYGKDHYATVSWSDTPADRRTVIGWMSNWQYAAEVPTKQFRSANTLPRDLSLFRDDDGQCYLASVPSPEMLNLRDRITNGSTHLNIGKKAKKISLPSGKDGICEIEMDLDARRSSSITLTLVNEHQEQVTMTFDAQKGQFSFDRTRSGLVDFSQDFPSVTVNPTHGKEGKVSLRIFIDRSSIEVFEKEGRFVQTNLVFPTSPYTHLLLQTDNGTAKVSNLRVYSLKY